TEQRVASDLNGHSRVQHEPAQRPAFADRTIAILTRPPPPEDQLARILNDDDVATRNPGRRARCRVPHHLAGRHGAIAQKARDRAESARPALPPPAAPRAAEYTSKPARQGPHATRSPFFQAAVAKPPQSDIDHHLHLRESTLDPRNQAAALSTTEMCAYDSRVRGEVASAASG